MMTNTINQTVSDARVDANRRNAQLSTGPRSDAGKARSSQNAARSGWFSRDLRVAEGKEQLYIEFEESWHRELSPEGLLELEAFTDFIRAAWHKREVIEAQNEVNVSSPSAFLDEAGRRQFDRLHRYERDFERRAKRAVAELRRLQTERALRARLSAQANPGGTALPPLAGAKILIQKQTQAPPLNLPEDLRLHLHIMEIETNHWKALLRARKAGLTSDPLTAS